LHPDKAVGKFETGNRQDHFCLLLVIMHLSPAFYSQQIITSLIIVYL